MYGGVHRCADVHGDVQMGAWRCTEGCAGVRRCAKVCGGAHWVHGGMQRGAWMGAWRCVEVCRGLQRCMEVCRGVHRSA